MNTEEGKPNTLVLNDGNAREIYVSIDGDMLEIDNNVFTKKEAAQLRDFINAFLGEGGVQRHMLSELHISPNSCWREAWYMRNVGNMTRETMERNMKDLKEIKATQNLTWEETDDIQKAMNILHDSLMGIKPPSNELHDIVSKMPLEDLKRRRANLQNEVEKFAPDSSKRLELIGTINLISDELYKRDQG